MLIKVVKKLLDDGYHPIVFCRYIPTSEYVAEHLDGNARPQDGRRVRQRHPVPGAAPGPDRQAGEATQEDGSRRVLVATDCLSEGVNLQHYFNAIIHYDLAWNPTRHEQREGRVDRFGQRSDEVRVVTIYGNDNGIDGKVLEVLIKKHREIRKSTGISVPIPDETSSQVTDAIVEWLLMRDQGDQQTLFGLDEVIGKTGDELETQWNSMAERERRLPLPVRPGQHPPRRGRPRGRRDPRGPRPGRGDPRVHPTALTELGADITTGRRRRVHRHDGEPPARPARLDRRADRRAAEACRSAPPPPSRAARPRSPAPTRSSRAVAELRAVRCAGPARPCRAPARPPLRRHQNLRCRKRTMVLLVRYRYQLILPGRYGDVPLIAEDARVLGFDGAPRPRPNGCRDAERPRCSARSRTRTRCRSSPCGPSAGSSSGLDEVLPDVNARGAGVRRRAPRGAPPGPPGRRPGGPRPSGSRVAGDADILGVYVYLPVTAEMGAGQ